MKEELKVIIMRGLPASGKSTFADEYIKEHPNTVKIEKDEIRKDSRLFPGGVYNHKRGDEGIVLKERDRLIRQSLQEGKSVISSDTNLVQKHISQLSNIARQNGAKVEVVSFLDVPLKELINRDSKRNDKMVGEQVIRKMFHEHVKKMPTYLEYNPSLPFVVISDLDGTLTLGPKDRSPYEWHKVGNDDLNIGVAHLLDGIKMIDYAKVFIFSGRDEVCRPETEAWLEKNDIEYDGLFMRRSDHLNESGGQVADTLVKAEMIDNYIRGKYNVLLWLDDRTQIANMLRDVYGINVAQLGDPNWHF
jgi:predicted kinase